MGDGLIQGFCRFRFMLLVVQVDNMQRWRKVEDTI